MISTGDDFPKVIARYILFSVAIYGCILFFIETAFASNAAIGLSKASQKSFNVPQWLYVATGGAAIGASALLASTVTDRTLINTLHDQQTSITARMRIRRLATIVGRVIGILCLGLVLYRGFFGPQIPTVNVALIIVFAGVRAGLTMFAYLVGNVWPILNPWRTIADSITGLVPTSTVSYPDRFSRWPAVIGLLLFVWVETVTPVNKQPDLLAVAILVYTIVTIVGAVLFSPSTWFANVDPISVAFRFYGEVAPFRWQQEKVSLRPPGFELPQSDTVFETADIAFIIALIWELTFSGFVTTTVGGSFIRSIVAFGIPPLMLYLLIFVGGYSLFFGAYLKAANIARETGETYLTPHTIGIQFAASLLAIAAGYHLAHYFGFFVSLSPLLATTIVSPFSPPANPLVLSLPGWFGMLPIAFVLIGHMLAVWVTHTKSYDLFPSRLQAIRSQYSFIIVMIGYTIISLWLVSLPTASPPFVS
ncbi:hypothetical protein [Haladaptatus sp. DYF46]|uniref:hypothetical protein n=1 Tax=Haladaptatus sp. DYF46 TaxID=2886041 RepID=UPI001E2EB207|nr:hypothetical protein [Haladaptatus sp. DYF46]